MNTVSLSGRLAKEIELRKTQNDLSVVSFAIAVDRIQNGQKVADFIDCVAWRQSAEYLAKYAKKGDIVLVEGSLQTRKYQRNDGTNAKAVEVVASRVQAIPRGERESVHEEPQFEPQVVMEESKPIMEDRNTFGFEPEELPFY